MNEQNAVYVPRHALKEMILRYCVATDKTGFNPDLLNKMCDELIAEHGMTLEEVQK